MRFLLIGAAGVIGLMLSTFNVQPLYAAENRKSASDTKGVYTQDQLLQVAKQYGIQWTRVAAVVNYEKTRTVKSMGIQWPSYLWGGPMNPNEQEISGNVCRFYGGVGVDADGDGKADPANDQDALAAIGKWLSRSKRSEASFEQVLAEKYDRADIRKRIIGFESVYDKFGSYTLREYQFPIPKNYDYSYRDGWGDRRGWGGRRIHEGTDIFAGYGTPVRATTYGYIEIKGWNAYGGWRIGLRGIDNVYYYYAHLSSFAKGISEGTVVKPGQILGYVGSSGYGKLGTSGKFQPHLHFGMYRGAGIKEWAYDPYPNLKRWERAAKK